jgi:hypothetical protein
VSRVRYLRAALPLALGVLNAVPSYPQAPGSLAACAVIEDAAQRLACYDRASGRPSAPPAPAAPAAAAAAKSVTPAPAAAPPSPQAFGLYAAEHPAPPPGPPSLSAKVVALGAAPNGRPTVTLEGGQLWELDETDPLLAQGDAVTIRRAALGSFIMTTPSQRTHRVHRLH